MRKHLSETPERLRSIKDFLEKPAAMVLGESDKG